VRYSSNNAAGLDTKQLGQARLLDETSSDIGRL